MLENLGRVPLAVSALLRTSLSGREVLQLRPGDVVSLGVPVERPLTIRVGRMDQFEGVPVRTGRNAGISLTALPDTSMEGAGQ